MSATPITDDEVVLAEMLITRGYGITPISRLLGRDRESLQRRMMQMRKDRRMRIAGNRRCPHCGVWGKGGKAQAVRAAVEQHPVESPN